MVRVNCVNDVFIRDNRIYRYVGSGSEKMMFHNDDDPLQLNADDLQNTHDEENDDDVDEDSGYENVSKVRQYQSLL